jgi:hypothetical protein
MNELQARIIMIVRNGPKSVTDIVRGLCERKFVRGYSHICNNCSLLSVQGLLKRREMNEGTTRGRPAFYTATPSGITEALKYIDELVIQRKNGVDSSNITNPLTSYFNKS